MSGTTGASAGEAMHTRNSYNLAMRRRIIIAVVMIVAKALAFLVVQGLGFEILDQQVAEAHQPVDFSFGAWFAANRLAPELNLPWMAPSGPIDRARRTIGMTLGTPLMVAGLIADQVIAPVLKHYDGNTYRVLARLPAER